MEPAGSSSLEATSDNAEQPVTDVQTLVFFDLEATGLNCNTLPPRITELSMLAIRADHFLAFDEVLKKSTKAAIPRVTNKLTLCFNPQTALPQIVSDMTGLTNEMLEEQHGFDGETACVLRAFLSHLPQPVCLVAHNGNMYDYPLLNAELKRCQSDLSVLTADSLEILKTVYENDRQMVNGEVEAVRDLLAAGEFDDDMEELDLDAVHSYQEQLEGNQVPSVTTTPVKNRAYRLPVTPPLSSAVKKPRLHGDDNELVLNVSGPHPSNSDDIEDNGEEVTPEKCDSQVGQFNLPPPSGHTQSRKIAADALSAVRRSEATKARKKLDFSSMPPSFSLPKLHEFLFGARPSVVHGAEADVLSLLRVCAMRAKPFVQCVNERAVSLQKSTQMW